jgi:hypothetical protein
MALTNKGIQPLVVTSTASWSIVKEICQDRGGAAGPLRSALTAPGTALEASVPCLILRFVFALIVSVWSTMRQHGVSTTKEHVKNEKMEWLWLNCHAKWLLQKRSRERTRSPSAQLTRNLLFLSPRISMIFASCQPPELRRKIAQRMERGGVGWGGLGAW